MADSPEPLTFIYRFSYPDKSCKEFRVSLDSQTLQLIPKQRREHPYWAMLDYHQCPNCPLNKEKSPLCPIAASIEDIVEFFKDSISYDKVQVDIVTAERTYSKETTHQKAISSMIGIYMVTAGCPILDKLKPMVRTHLPFASLEETVYRSISMYLLAQYFLSKRGKKPDWNLEQLLHSYEEIGKVNRAFTDRLSSTKIQDAVLNAVVHLNSFADIAKLALEGHGLDRIERIFKAYLEE